MQSSSPTARRSLAAGLVATGFAAGLAGGYPEGAPWGTANPGADEACDSCHYDYEPVRDSAALGIDGLPAAAVAGSEHDLVVTFEDADAKTAGFQLLAAAGDDGAGQLRSDDPDVETIGAAARSTQPQAATDGSSWRLRWSAPAKPGPAVTFHVAASSANDDQSPFGDRIHYRSFDVALTEE